MSDTLIIYYSLEGNIDFAARTLARELQADTFRLETVKEYPTKGLAKFLHGGKDSTFSARPELKAPLPDLAPYATVILGAPVWAGKPAAPLNTAIASMDCTGKTVAAFVSSASGNGEKALAAIGSALNGATLTATASLKNPARAPEAALTQLKDFAARIRR